MNQDNTVRPVGLKGREVLSRIQELMQKTSANEVEVKNSVLELTKTGADSKIYGIVRESHKYYIKIAEPKENLVVEDFKYIGGLQNIDEEEYPTYAKAIKRLNTKLISLAEAYGVEKPINTFINENAQMAIATEGFKEEVDETCECAAKMEEEALEEEGYEALPKGIEEVFKSVDDIKKKT